MHEVKTRLVPTAMFPNRRQLHWIPLEATKARWRRSVAQEQYSVSIHQVQTVGLAAAVLSVGRVQTAPSDDFDADQSVIDARLHLGVLS